MLQKSISELLSLTFIISSSRESKAALDNGWYGRAIQAIFLRAVEQSYSHSYAALLHKPNHLRPYSVSSLTKVNSVLPEENKYAFKICSLNQATSAALLTCTHPGAMLSKGSNIDLSGILCHISEWSINAECNYKDLLDITSAKQENSTACFELELESPFFYKETKTKKYMSEPNKLTLFRSLLEKWKSYSSIPEPPGFIEFLSNSISLDISRLEKEKIERGSFTRTGSKGKLTVHTEESNNPSWAFLLSLARFAKYAGVGKDTSIGFGQARLLSDY
jgi:CRISPR-associated endoribonuclease Cas6